MSRASAASEEELLTSALNLTRRMPPSSIENSLAGLIELVPELTDELLNHVDQPLKVRKDPKTNQEYILCDYNRDGDSFRSPWSNQYYPAIDDGFMPSSRLRQLELEANKIFDVYRKQYFDGGFSSVYFFETEKRDEKSFGSCFLIHKDVVDRAKGLEKGWWDSIHVFEVTPGAGKNSFVYKLTTTVMVSMGLKEDRLGVVDLSGSMTKSEERKLPVDEREGQTHMQNLGVMIEDMELKIRNAIEGIYIQKTREVVNGMRSASAAREKAWAEVSAALSAAISAKKDLDE
jgi:capping protein beta